MPPPIGPSSTTTTLLPARASKYAVVSPAMPAPMMQTFVLVSWLSRFSFGVAAVAAQTETVVPEVGCIEISSASVVNMITYVATDMPSAGTSSQDRVVINNIGAVLNHDNRTGQNL